MELHDTRIDCLLDGARGIYIPRDFAEMVDADAWHISDEDIEVLLNPDDDDYWEVWQEVLDTAYLTDDDGWTWKLCQEQDLFCIRSDYEGVDDGY